MSMCIFRCIIFFNTNPVSLLEDAYFPIVITELSNTFDFKDFYSFFYEESAIRKSL